MATTRRGFSASIRASHDPLAAPLRTAHLTTVMAPMIKSRRISLVINYIGDGVLAVFGLPRPQSDDAARAMATVESLNTSAAAWVADLPPVARDRLDFRIGVHFGPAILSRLGSPTHQQIAAAGDTVNVASRLLGVAKQRHCRVVVSEDLFAAARATPGSTKNVRGGLLAANGSHSRPNGFHAGPGSELVQNVGG
jgi:class 3 adenylate cyclase